MRNGKVIIAFMHIYNGTVHVQHVFDYVTGFLRKKACWNTNVYQLRSTIYPHVIKYKHLFVSSPCQGGTILENVITFVINLQKEKENEYLAV